jgi:hypothetical protein
MIDYLVVLDTLNFCFWIRGGRWSINYNGEQHNGYFALSLALKEYFEKYQERLDWDYFSRISFREFSEILQGGANLMFLKKRWQILRAVAAVLIKKYGGGADEFIASANGSAAKLVEKTHKELPSFDDAAAYGGRKIYFLKRAQILAVDIHAALNPVRNRARPGRAISNGVNGSGLGRLDDLDYFTAFADYKLPQILRHYRVLEYSPRLRDKIDKQILIPAGSREEVEIRAAIVWVVEYLKDELEKLGRKFYAFEIDWILWNKSREEKIDKPYHLTKTIFY